VQSQGDTSESPCKEENDREKGAETIGGPLTGTSGTREEEERNGNGEKSRRIRASGMHGIVGGRGKTNSTSAEKKEVYRGAEPGSGEKMEMSGQRSGRTDSGLTESSGIERGQRKGAEESEIRGKGKSRKSRR
jgi:hypothetical protein